MDLPDCHGRTGAKPISCSEKFKHSIVDPRATIDTKDEAKMQVYQAGERFVRWLEKRVTVAARGDENVELAVQPSGLFWLGRLASEDAVLERDLGDRGERLEPCAVGLVLRPKRPRACSFTAHVEAVAWLRREDGLWNKSPKVHVEIPIALGGAVETSHGRSKLAQALTSACGAAGLAAEVRTELRFDIDGNPELDVQLVNVSPKEHDDFADTNLYECALEVHGLETEDFLLDALPDSFRYDRRVAAYGINGGVERLEDGGLRSTDVVGVERCRPVYWGADAPIPDLRFETLADDPLPRLHQLAGSFAAWGEGAWGAAALDERGRRDGWTESMRAEARESATAFETERSRIAAGIELLEADSELLRAFRLMNEAIGHSSGGKYDSWRPFQIGFLLANLRSIVEPAAEAEFADIVWFATGGGKTETYLGLLVTAALYDRLRGKKAGITAWSRFPLRMLSLQQTQRFANAMAGAELARRRAGIGGDPFSVGFFVGAGATPNRIEVDPKDASKPNPEDDEMPGRYQVLLQCPFCRSTSITMAFDRRSWTLQHRCSAEGCPWNAEPLPFYVVDEEIYRFLPTVVVGTLDKAATISMQAAMRGFVGAPLGRCSGNGHGYAYAKRTSRPNGCLVPGCRRKVEPVDMEPALFAPTYRLQDELHLLRDSLGAVDAHYESLLDGLQREISGTRPKILASSATLNGYQKQSRVLYQREGRVFPAQGPSVNEGFWTTDSEKLARRFVAVAPRGVTLEFAVDRMATALQGAVRRLLSEPDVVCEQAGVPVEFAPKLLDLYGVDVVYGNTLRDLEAASRSLETQVAVEGNLNTASLTGRTEFDDVRAILQRLEAPEESFDDRLHVITASSMMSHGVDIDRLNVMAVMGLPLTTAEFIQTTARIGRTWPGLVFVLHKIGRERDAAVYRSFPKFVTHGDRFVEPVPVTRRSRRVLARTLPGLELARLLMVHEPNSKEALTTVAKLRAWANDGGEFRAETEREALEEILGFDGEFDAGMREDLRRWITIFFRNLEEPPGDVRLPKDLCPDEKKPMISLRDVEEQAPILGITQ